MSYQVGAACYATIVDAGGAACAQYAPVSGVVENGAVVRTVSCTSVDLTTGALNLQITSTPVDGSPSSTRTVAQSISYPPCIYSDYVQAAEVIFGSVLAVWAAIYGIQKIRGLLNWSRGETL